MKFWAEVEKEDSPGISFHDTRTYNNDFINYKWADTGNRGLSEYMWVHVKECY